MRLGVSIDAGKAPEKEPLAQSGGSGKVSKAEEAESAFVGQIKASKPSDRGQRQPGEGVRRQPGGAGFSLERHPQLSLATRGEDWASQGQPKGMEVHRESALPSSPPWPVAATGAAF